MIRVESEYDESSCICGLSKGILDRLESALRLASSQNSSCSIEDKTGTDNHAKEISKSDGPFPDSQHSGNHAENSEHKNPQKGMTESSQGLAESSNEAGGGDHNAQKGHPSISESNSPQPTDSQPTTEQTNTAETSGNLAELNQSIKRPSRPQSHELQSHSDKNTISAHEPEIPSSSHKEEIQNIEPAHVEDGQKNKQQSNSNELQSEPSNPEYNSEYIAKLTAEINRLESIVLSINPSASSKPASTKPSQVEHKLTVDGPEPHQMKHDEPEASNMKPASQSGSTFTSFLGGLPTSMIDSSNGALLKLNQSKSVNPNDMENALQSTIPGVVSNIFSNINNLTSQVLHQQDGSGGGVESETDQPGKLVSIDGSSVDIKGDTTEQISAEGEKLFLRWIEHQLDALHLTASMANYIRKNSINLFRRIVKQYIERIERLGGSIEENVRKATQMALGNTQNLITFLLKNYINFAGGLMQIIGEQVSRVGKQLDSTGDSIAHMSLNPFDIVSSVIESLPNPSDYANYFRAFGKQLMNEYTAGQQSTNESKEQQDTNQGDSQTGNVPQRPKGLITKTMGALSKTLGSWLG